MNLFNFRLLLSVRLLQALQHFHFKFLQFFLLLLFLVYFLCLLHQEQVVLRVKRFELGPLVLGVLYSEGLGQDAVVELLLLDSVEVLAVQHGPLLSVDLRFFLHLLRRFVILVF